MAQFDVLLPYWGDVSLFKETVESIRAQTYTDWRLFISDDCYPSDEAQEYIASLDDPRIEYYRHEKNIGITRNFNYCIEAAQAPYCVLIGCDDRMLPNYIETALASIDEADFYQPGVEIIDSKGATYLPLTDRIKRFLMPKKSGVYSGEKLATSLCHGNWLYFPAITWKTATIKKYGFNQKYKIVEDLALEFEIILNNGSMYFDTAPAFQYRRFSESLSSKEKGKSGVRFKEEKEVYTDFSKKFSNKKWHRAARAAKWRITSRLNELLSR